MLSVNKVISKITKAKNAIEIEQIQSLWSGYGMISRYALTESKLKTVIVKKIVFPNKVNHPKGWNTTQSHNRKVKSYEVEIEWYKRFATLCNNNCRVPKCYGIEKFGAEQIIVLEDLDVAGFPLRKSALTKDEVKLCLKWLANFHGTFLDVKPELLWTIGTYWHLKTRKDEMKEMSDSSLKQDANKIDYILNSCKFQTIVHGDAKVANFCFSDDMTKVAAVDFQYVGGGCGIKDVAYLLGSCLSENECKIFEKELLDFYFINLEVTLDKNGKSHIFSDLKAEWSCLYSYAWADFTRFLMGWNPGHQKINGYSKIQVDKVLKELNY